MANDIFLRLDDEFFAIALTAINQSAWQFKDMPRVNSVVGKLRSLQEIAHEAQRQAQEPKQGGQQVAGLTPGGTGTMSGNPEAPAQPQSPAPEQPKPAVEMPSATPQLAEQPQPSAQTPPTAPAAPETPAPETPADEKKK